MMTRRSFTFSALTVAAFSQLPAQAQTEDEILIDDMSQAPLTSYGGQWQLSTDRVMGGISQGSARMIRENDRLAIEMTGNVSTANNGGFVQVSMRLQPRLDATGYRGVELDVRGDGHPYWVHLRDRNTRWPWQVYHAAYETTGDWQTVRLPFASFQAYHRTTRRLDPSSITRIGLVAGYDDFQAHLKIVRVSVYR